jgi:hypothetical protein
MAHCPRLSPGGETTAARCADQEADSRGMAAEVGRLEAEALGVGMHDIADGPPEAACIEMTKWIGVIECNRPRYRDS